LLSRLAKLKEEKARKRERDGLPPKVPKHQLPRWAGRMWLYRRGVGVARCTSLFIVEKLNFLIVEYAVKVNSLPLVLSSVVRLTTGPSLGIQFLRAFDWAAAHSQCRGDHLCGRGGADHHAQRTRLEVVHLEQGAYRPDDMWAGAC
jgi:hypothetical protein